MGHPQTDESRKAPSVEETEKKYCPKAEYLTTPVFRQEEKGREEARTREPETTKGEFPHHGAEVESVRTVGEIRRKLTDTGVSDKLLRE